MPVIRVLVLNITVLFVIYSFSQPVELGEKIFLQLKNQPLRLALLEIQKQSGINIIFDDKLVERHLISCNIDNAPAEDAIKTLLRGINISYQKFDEKYFVLFEKDISKRVSYKAVVEQETIHEIDTTYSLTQPVLLTRTDLLYPFEALVNNVEGKVKVKLFINKMGYVDESMIEKSSGSEILDSTAVDYARTLKFKPALANNEPINVWLSMAFVYKITNKD